MHLSVCEALVHLSRIRLVCLFDLALKARVGAELGNSGSGGSSSRSLFTFTLCLATFLVFELLTGPEITIKEVVGLV